MYYTDGFPKSDLRQFINNDDCVDSVPVYESQNCFPQLWSLLTRRRHGYEVIGDDRKDDDDEQEQRPILAWIIFDSEREKNEIARPFFSRVYEEKNQRENRKLLENSIKKNVSTKRKNCNSKFFFLN